MKTPSLLLAAVVLASPLQAEPAAAAPAGLVPLGVVKNVSPEDAAKLLKDHPKIVVLDVRTPEEFAGLESIARAKGFLMVSASPLTRSSYHADSDFAELKAARLHHQATKA